MTSAMSDDATHIVRSLTLEEKVRLLSGNGPWHLEPLERFGLPSILVADGPHGVRTMSADDGRRGDGSTRPATCFPTAAGLGASWNEDLIEEVGRALGLECRAMGVSVLLGPGLNIKRHPAGGRNFEYFSEDPLLSGRLAAAMVTGVQSQGVGACPKHYAVNNHEHHRMVVDVLVDERTLREVYLTGFELVVRNASPWTVMCAYNKVNGTYCAEHESLLTTLLRDAWGFDGLVMSDWGATNDRVAGVQAGLDLEMPGSGGSHDADLIAAVRSGRLPVVALDGAVTRVVELMQRSVVAEGDRSRLNVDLDAHHQLARRAAAEASVLLTNDGVLPLGDVSVALIGGLAQRPRYQGAGSSQVRPTRVDTILDAMRAHFSSDPDMLHVAGGYDASTGDSTDAQIAGAVAAARSADVAVVVAGLPGSYESEGFDRPHLLLPEGQTRLLEAVTTAAPTVVVLCNGAPVEMPWAERPAAILEVYLGGQAGGSGVVDVLFGAAEPGGRLAESFPVAVGDLPADRNFPGSRWQVQYRETCFVGYRFHDTAAIPARFPFGHGLSYTRFEYADLSVSDEASTTEAQLTVTNVGSRPGSEVVQCYVRPPASTVLRPDKELRDFAKVHLEPGQSVPVTLRLDGRAFSRFDVASKDWVVDPGEYEILVGASSVDIRLRATVERDGTVPVGVRVRTPTELIADDEAFGDLLGRPVPPPPPARPFHRNSTVSDLAGTFLGRGLARLLGQAARREVGAMLDSDDEATRKMVETMIAQAPLRALVSLSGGRLSLTMVDRLLDVLNGRWLKLVRSGARTVTRRG